nr:unnamed protein product [Callosobruchus chinensis]
MKSSPVSDQRKQLEGFTIAQYGVLKPVLTELPKTSKLEATNNEFSYERLMSLSSDLEPPQELVKTETSTLITSTYFDSSFKMLQSHINDLFTNQQKRVTLATLTDVYPNEVFTSQQSQTTLTTLNNVYRDDDFQQSSQSESDPYATDHDSDDPDFILDNQGNNNVQQVESSDTETENEDVTKENRKTRKRKRKMWKTGKGTTLNVLGTVETNM